MKNALLALIVFAVTISRAEKLIYESCGTRREILPPVCGYLVMDTMGNFSELPNLKYGEAMVLFSDGVHLRYSIIEEPLPNSPTVIYSDGDSKRAHKVSDEEFTELNKKHFLSVKPTRAEIEKEEILLAQIMAIHGATNKTEFIREEQRKINSGYYEEQKRKQNEELRKLWGY